MNSPVRLLAAVYCFALLLASSRLNGGCGCGGGGAGQTCPITFGSMTSGTGSGKIYASPKLAVSDPEDSDEDKGQNQAMPQIIPGSPGVDHGSNAKTVDKREAIPVEGLILNSINLKKPVIPFTASSAYVGYETEIYADPTVHPGTLHIPAPAGMALYVTYKGVDNSGNLPPEQFGPLLHGFTISSFPNVVNINGNTFSDLLLVRFQRIDPDPWHPPGEVSGLELSPSTAAWDGDSGHSTAFEAGGSDFTFWLGNDTRDTVVGGANPKKGLLWGWVEARPSLMFDVAGHQFRFLTAHSKVRRRSGASGGMQSEKEVQELYIDERSGTADPVTNEKLGSRYYQVKTSQRLMELRETTTSLSPLLKTVRLSLFDSDDGTNTWNTSTKRFNHGTAPQHGSVEFQQTARIAGGSTTATSLYKRWAGGVDPDTATAPDWQTEFTKAVTGASRETLTTTVQEKVGAALVARQTTIQDSVLIPDTGADPPFEYQTGEFLEWGRMRVTASTTREGGSAGQVTSTARHFYHITSNGEKLVRSEQGSVTGGPLLADSVASGQCLTFVNHKPLFDGVNGTITYNLNADGVESFSKDVYAGNEWEARWGTTPTFSEPSSTSSLVQKHLSEGPASGMPAATTQRRTITVSSEQLPGLNAGAPKMGMMLVAEEEEEAGVMVRYTNYGYSYGDATTVPMLATVTLPGASTRDLQGAVRLLTRYEVESANTEAYVRAEQVMGGSPPSPLTYRLEVKATIADIVKTGLSDNDYLAALTLLGRPAWVRHTDGTVTRYRYAVTGFTEVTTTAVTVPSDLSGTAVPLQARSTARDAYGDTVSETAIIVSAQRAGTAYGNITWSTMATTRLTEYQRFPWDAAVSGPDAGGEVLKTIVRLAPGGTGVTAGVQAYSPRYRLRYWEDETGFRTTQQEDAVGRLVEEWTDGLTNVPATRTKHAYGLPVSGFAGTAHTVSRGAPTGSGSTNYTLFSTEQMDTAGRVCVRKDAAGLTTETEYAPLVETVTLPQTGGTIVRTLHPDGSVASETGAVVPTSSYWTTGDDAAEGKPAWMDTFLVGAVGGGSSAGSLALSLPTCRIKVTSRGATSPQVLREMYDPLDRLVARWGIGDDVVFCYTTRHQVAAVRRNPSLTIATSPATAPAPIALEYDGWGELSLLGPVTTGTTNAYPGGGGLSYVTAASTNPFELYVRANVNVGGVWYASVEKKAYLGSGNGVLTLLEKTLTRLSPDPAGTPLLGETRVTDAGGVETVTEIRVNPVAKEKYVWTKRAALTAKVEEQVWRGGQLALEKDVHATAYTGNFYDAYGRLVERRDPVTNRSSLFGYDAADRPTSETDLAGNNTWATYYPNTGAQAGRLNRVISADGSYVEYVYDLLGRVTHQSGGGEYPQSFVYDDAGRMTQLWTYRANPGNTPNAGLASITTWGYEYTSGLLTSKTDAAGKTSNYVYWPGTRLLKERQWARWKPGSTTVKLTTTYSYDGAQRLSGIAYNDGGLTPSVSLTYDRAGRLASTTDAAGITAYTRATNGIPTNESISGSSHLLAGVYVSRSVSLGRVTAVSAGGSPIFVGGATVATSYAYEPAATGSGRMATVTAAGAKKVDYAYLPGTSREVSRAFRPVASPPATPWQEQVYGYDEAGRLNQATYKINGTVSTAFYYTHDAGNRRNLAVREDGTQWVYGYSSKGEVTSARQKLGGSYLAGRQWIYTYDEIGNRVTAKSGGATNGLSGLRTINHGTGVAGGSANTLNQYTAIANPATFDLHATASASSALTADLGGGTATAYPTAQPTSGVARWRHELTATDPATSPNLEKPRWETTRTYENAVLKKQGVVRLPPKAQALTYDDDGNLLSDGTWTYTWDAENRLRVAEQTVTPISSYVAVTTLRKEIYDYDWRGRRIMRTLQSRPAAGGSWTTNGTYKNVYDGWNLIAEIYPGYPPAGRYHWGPDISGTMYGAGGVGGLLMAENNGSTLFCAYDGNGNVVAASHDTNAVPAAQYEYDAFGNTLRVAARTGTSFADALPFRFSTKFSDDGTGLVYYGFRYYHAQMGRWLGKDPIMERGGRNLFGMLKNDPVNSVDFLGLLDTTGYKPSGPVTGNSSSGPVTGNSSSGGSGIGMRVGTALASLGTAVLDAAISCAGVAAGLLATTVTTADATLTGNLPSALLPWSPTMPSGLSPQKQQKWKECNELYDEKENKQSKRADADKKLKAENSPCITDNFCRALWEAILANEAEIDARKEYMKNDCDEFDWFNAGTTEKERREAHRNELKNRQTRLDKLKEIMDEKCKFFIP